MTADRRHLVAGVGLLVVVAGLVWMLSTAYPTSWCSLIGTCTV